MDKKYEYELAVSYASEDNKYVDEFVRKVERLISNVFYDKNSEVQMWGNNIHSYLYDIFCNKSKNWIIFLSSAYINKTWTNHEIDSIFDSMIHQNDSAKRYILTVRLDDSVEMPPGMTKNLKSLNASDYTPESLANIVARKLIDYSMDSDKFIETTTSLNDLFQYLKVNLEIKLKAFTSKTIFSNYSAEDYRIHLILSKNSSSIYEFILHNEGILGTKQQLSIWDSIGTKTSSDEKISTIICLSRRLDRQFKVINFGFWSSNLEKDMIFFASKEELFECIWNKLQVVAAAFI